MKTLIELYDERPLENVLSTEVFSIFTRVQDAPRLEVISVQFVPPSLVI